MTIFIPTLAQSPELSRSISRSFRLLPKLPKLDFISHKDACGNRHISSQNKIIFASL